MSHYHKPIHTKFYEAYQTAQFNVSVVSGIWRLTGWMKHDVSVRRSGIIESPVQWTTMVLTHDLCSETATLFRNVEQYHSSVGRIAQSADWATGWTVRVSNPGGERFSTPVQTSPEVHPAWLLHLRMPHTLQVTCYTDYLPHVSHCINW
jgi:hypothetical protein